jgi:C-terminal processing protease CtpA/Prc
VAIAWNALQHFYPYFEVVQANWPDELRRALDKAALDVDERNFLDTLAQLTVPLRDGHIVVQHPIDSGTFRPPLTCAWIEGDLVVTHVDDSSLTLKSGDIITKINGRVTAAAVAEAERLISGASVDSIRLRAIYRLLRGEENTEIALQLKSSTGVLSSVVLRRVLDVAQYPLEHRPAQLKELAPNIFYVDVDQFSQPDFESTLHKLARSKGIVFDMRGYPSGEVKNATGILPHLTSAPIDSPRWGIPIVALPDQRSLSFKFDQWTVQPRQPHLSVPLAFLQDARTISYLETLLGFVDYFKLGTIVGQNSAGTNGNVIWFSIPGGYRLRFTGLKTLRQDGSRHHTIGIRPGILVQRTLKGVSEGRDEILERAVTALTGTSPTANH